MDVIRNIKKIRTDRRLSQEDAAEALGITQQQYSRYETGANEIPVRHVVTLCRFYNISADWLLGLKENLEYANRRCVFSGGFGMWSFRQAGR